MARFLKLNVFTAISVYNICYTHGDNAFNYFVNGNATYSHDCGNWTHPCPTLYDMFLNIDFADTRYHITINVDGQNITDIMSRKQENNTYNPCLPLPITMNNEYEHTDLYSVLITITFSNNTHDLNDWFPRDLCHGTYRNEYMFDINIPCDIEIYNLIINDYSTSTMGFVRSSGSESYCCYLVECIHCKFININSTSNKPWFDGMDRVILDNTEFRNIQTTTSIKEGVGKIYIYSTVFINVNASQSLFTNSNKAVFSRILVYDSVFYNISTPFYIIFDENRKSSTRKKYGVEIKNTAIHLLSGSIYYSNHVDPTAINIYNVSVSTAAVRENNNPLFLLASSDATTMYMMHILYLYDTNHLCEVDQIIQTSSEIDASCLRLLCQNPPTLLLNEGQLEMSNITIDIELQNVMNDELGSCIQYSYVSDNGLVRAPFIRNKKHMIIHDMLVMRSISHILLYNEAELIVSNLHIIPSDVMNFNSLQSEIIIRQLNELSSIFVNESYFYGAKTHITATHGILLVYDSVFERSNIALDIEDVQHLALINCTIINNGPLYGRLHSPFHAPAILINACDDVFLIGNLFSGFNFDSLVDIKTIYNNLVIDGNTFVYSINESEFFYNVSIIYEGYELYYWRAPLYIRGFRGDSYAVIIDNVFLEFESVQHVEVPWIEFHASSACLSGNTFSNYAFRARFSDITSCFRPNIIDCVNNNTECIYQLYGSVNESLFDRINKIVVYAYGPGNLYPETIPIIIIKGSILALDNVHIINNSSITAAIIMDSSYEFQFLLIDSYVPPDVLLVTHEECYPTYYERLKSDANYISRLLMDCNSSQFDMSQETVYITSHSVNHMSVMKINLTVTSSLYYPGDLLKFEYHATDKFDNIVTDDGIDTTINIQTDSFLSTFNVENNICTNCEIGLLLTDVSLKHIGTKYEMEVVVRDSFIATYHVLSVTITGCPVGYSPDNNNFQCQPCNTDYYNIHPNNTDKCASCDLFNNDGVKCSEGNILVHHNHWLGFDENGNMISARCPPKYCCTKQDGCDYMHQNTDILCGENRDYTSRLCGKCKNGYSESMTSKRCIKCESNFHFQYLLFPLCLSIASALLLLRVDSNRTNTQHRSRNDYLKLMMKIMIFKCMFYYEQAISETVKTSVFTSLNIFTSIFNLSLITETDVIGDICFVNGLNAKQKILMDLFIPIMLLFTVLILFIISQYALQTPLTIRGKRVNFAKTFLTMYVLMIGKILDVLFRLLSCVNLGNIKVHFYFGYEECYGVTWFSSLIALIFVITGFASLFVKLQMATISERNNPKYVLFVFTSRYKPHFYWWEFIIFLRRITICLFAALIQDMTLRLVFVIIIVFSAFLQQLYNPFIIQEANNMEFILLCCLNIIILSQFPYALELNEFLISIGISILIVFPIPLIIFYVVIVIIRTRKVTKERIPDECNDFTDQYNERTQDQMCQNCQMITS